MLMECPECKAQLSSEAASCPHCGHPNPSIESGPSILRQKNGASGKLPAFLIASVVGFFLCLGTPRLIVVLPILATIVLAIVSIVRHEKFRVGAFAVILLAVGLFFLSSADFNTKTNATDIAASAKIDDWNWSADPSFGTKGTIKWTVAVSNLTDRPIRNAKVEFTTYDSTGKLLASTFTYVDAIPPHGTGSNDSFADYFGGESKAQVQLTEVNFEN